MKFPASMQRGTAAFAVAVICHIAAAASLPGAGIQRGAPAPAAAVVASPLDPPEVISRRSAPAPAAASLANSAPAPAAASIEFSAPAPAAAAPAGLSPGREKLRGTSAPMPPGAASAPAPTTTPKLPLIAPERLAEASESEQELPSVMVRFEMKNIDYNKLEEPVEVSPVINLKATSLLQKVSLDDSNAPVAAKIEDKGEMSMSFEEPHTKTNAEALEEAIISMFSGVLSNEFGIGSQESMQSIAGINGSEAEALSQPAHTASESDSIIGGTAVTSMASKAAQHQTKNLRSSSQLAPTALSSPAMSPSAWSSSAAMSAPAPAPPIAKDDLLKKDATKKTESSSDLKIIKKHEQEETAQETDTSVKSLPVMSVTFQPGNVRDGDSVQDLQSALDSGAAISTVVIVNVVDRPGTGHDRIDEVEDALRSKVLDGTLQDGLAMAVYGVIHANAIFGELDESKGSVKPYNMTLCAKHLQNLVDNFSRTYTRGHVPRALYHACENYETKSSFSHDVIVNKADKMKCKKATKKFIKMWQYGKGEVDYGSFCLSLCELKHGEDAIRCDAFKHIAVGK